MLTALIKNRRLALNWERDLKDPSEADEDDPDLDNTNPTMYWLDKQESLLELDSLALAEKCQKDFNSSRKPTEEGVWESILEDMVKLQSRFRQEYRRFVIITDSTGYTNTAKDAAHKLTRESVRVRDMVSV